MFCAASTVTTTVSGSRSAWSNYTLDGVTNTDMGAYAVREALREAGDPPFQAAFCGTAYGGVASGH